MLGMDFYSNLNQFLFTQKKGENNASPYLVNDYNFSISSKESPVNL